MSEFTEDDYIILYWKWIDDTDNEYRIEDVKQVDSGPPYDAATAAGMYDHDS